jgi:hypothetical protein
MAIGQPGPKEISLFEPFRGKVPLGNQLFEQGQLRFDTVYRFKGQQAPLKY